MEEEEKINDDDDDDEMIMRYYNATPADFPVTLLPDNYVKNAEYICTKVGIPNSAGVLATLTPNQLRRFLSVRSRGMPKLIDNFKMYVGKLQYTDYNPADWTSPAPQIFLDYLDYLDAQSMGTKSPQEMETKSPEEMETEEDSSSAMDTDDDDDDDNDENAIRERKRGYSPGTMCLLCSRHI